MACQHDRIMEISAKSSDLNCVDVPHLGIETEGYLPHIDNLCGGDYIQFQVCLDCGKVVGLDKITDKELRAIFKNEEIDDDDEFLELDDDDTVYRHSDWN